jgi:S-(hydroxymethyl)glutathione dehydrogenase/alcohol dehydrogenase
MKIKYPLCFKAAVLYKPHEPLVIEDVTFEGPLQPGQVLVRIYYSGICGKQIEEIEGTRPDPYLPHMLGHEGGGIVADIGPGVKKVSVGDSVVLHWLKGSGIQSDTPLYVKDKRRINAGWVTTFNEYGVISENRMTKIPQQDSLDIACLLGCAVTTGVGVILNTVKPLPLESVAVFGCGGIGLNAIQAAALIHASPIIAVDKNQESLKLAKKLGATHIFNTESCNVVEEIKKVTNPHGNQMILDAKNKNLKEAGADYVIVSLANPKAIESAIQSSAIPGKVYLVGVPPYESKITTAAFDIHAGRTLQGSHGGECIPDRDIPKYLELYNKGLLKFNELITNRVRLENINEGIEKIVTGKIGRCIVQMNHNDNKK